MLAEREQSFNERLYDLRQEVRLEALESNQLLSDFVSEMPHDETGDDIVNACLEVLLTENITEDKRHALRLSMAIEIEAMAERWADRCADTAEKQLRDGLL